MIPSLRQAVLSPPSISLPGFDPDARDYIRRVQAADGQRLEPLVQRAMDAFVRGCKADGIWNAIKASCILAGARTLAGALVPLVGAAPTNYNFVAGDYNRETGLLGDGSTKYLDTNTPWDSFPLLNAHGAVYRTTSETRTSTRVAMGFVDSVAANNSIQLLTTSSLRFYRCNQSSTTAGGISDVSTASGLWGVARSDQDNVTRRFNNSSDVTASSAGTTPNNSSVSLYVRNNSDFSDARIAFYSIGESLDLALLDTRVTTLINAIGAAL